MKYDIDPARQRYPFCIVWSPLGPLTWCFPFIGHTGISNSEGVILDFAGPYTISKGNFTFGAPTRYIQLDPSKCRDMDWDSAISQGCDIYSKRMHNICCDNCHSHVAKCLNIMGYDNKRSYNMVGLASWFFFFGNFVNGKAFVISVFPFLIILAAVILMGIYL